MKNKQIDKSTTIINDDYIWLSSKDNEMPAITNYVEVEGILQIDTWNNEFIDFIHLNKIDAIEIKGNKFEKTCFSLSFLKQVNDLKYLRISGKFSKKEYQVIELLTNLIELNLADYEGYELDFSKLAHLRAYFSIIKHDDHPIFQCAQLKYFGANTNLESLGALSKLKNLRKIFLFATKLETLQELESLKQLEILEILYASHLNVHFSFPHLPSLKKLVFDTCKNINSIDFLSKTPNIVCLSIPNCHNIETLKPLRECKKIEFLFIGNTKINDFDLSVLKTITTLKGLFFHDQRGYNYTTQDFQTLKKSCNV